MIEWIAAGFSEDAFWSKTPRQIWVHHEAHKLRIEREHRARAWLAWHTAAIARMKHLPKLEDLAGRTRTRPRRAAQTWQQQRDIGRMYTVLLEGTVTARNPQVK